METYIREWFLWNQAICARFHPGDESRYRSERTSVCVIEIPSWTKKDWIKWTEKIGRRNCRNTQENIRFNFCFISIWRKKHRRQWNSAERKGIDPRKRISVNGAVLGRSRAGNPEIFVSHLYRIHHFSQVTLAAFKTRVFHHDLSRSIGAMIFQDYFSTFIYIFWNYFYLKYVFFEFS